MPKDTNKNSKEKKHFFRDSKNELKKVNWLTPKQLVNNTVAVITIAILVAAIVFVLDFVFNAMNKHGVEKLKSMVGTTEQNETANETSDENAISNSTDSEAQDETSENSNETQNNEVSSQPSEGNNQENQTENTENSVNTENNETIENAN